MTRSEHVALPPSFEAVIAKWIAIAGAVGIVIQLIWCLHENLSDEEYFARHYILDQVDQLIGALTSNGEFDPVNGRRPLHYLPNSAGYGFRIIAADKQVLAEHNSGDIEAVAPSATRAHAPDFWQRKIGKGWFSVAGGAKRRVGRDYVWIDILTHGDPQFHRIRSLMEEIMVDVWTPLIPTVLLTTILGLVAARRSAMPLSNAAGRMRSLDPRADVLPLDVADMPREAAEFASAVNALIGRLGSIVQVQQQAMAHVAHELRTGLSIVLLEITKVAGDRARRLESDIDEMSYALQRFLAIARIKAADHVDIRLTSVSLKEVADKVADQLAPLAEVRSSRISVVDDHAEALMGDCASVVEAIRNVAENALKHGPKGNEVKISCGPGRVVTIDDSGPGLMTGDVERLFKPFERGNSHTEGAGLGLAIVKAAVDLHRGSIDVTNSPLGGARFTLRFENIISADTGDGVFREPDIAGRLIPP